MGVFRQSGQETGDDFEFDMFFVAAAASTTLNDPDFVVVCTPVLSIKPLCKLIYAHEPVILTQIRCCLSNGIKA